MRILILDDDTELAATLGDVLELAGHEVHAVESVAEARSALAGPQPFDTAVFDVNLGNSNAIGLLREVKQSLPGLRVVVITGGGTVEAEVGLPLATAHGADAVLFKPFSNDELLEQVAPTAPAPESA